MKAEDLHTLLKSLEQLKGDSGLFIKIYYQDNENYTVKFIDTITGQKVHTMRKNKNRKFKSLDNKGYMERYGKSHS